MKRSQLIFATVALPLDYLMVVLAGWLAYQLRFESFIRQSLPVRFDLPLVEFLPTLLLWALVWIALFGLSGLYNLQNQLKFSQEIGRVFLGCTAGLALIVVLFFFNPNLFNSRFIVLAGWGLALVLVSGGRLTLRLSRTALYKRGLGTTRLLIVGDDAATLALERLFTEQPKLGFMVIRRVSPNRINLERDTAGVDEVLVGDVTMPRSASLTILEYCLAHQVGFKYVADMFDAQSHNVVGHTLAGLPVIEIKRTPLDGWGRVLKRMFDLLGSFLLLVLLSPLFIIIAILILLDSGRPVIVGLSRVGEGGRVFTMYKFRSMIKNAQRLKSQLMIYNERADGPLFKMSNDPRVTRFGRVLRRLSLDELPQLWNVLCGQMSLVGPRPHEPQEVENYATSHRKLLNIKPGITGLGQVSGRSSLSFEEEVRLDSFYVENWSLAQDLVILAKTIVVLWQRKEAV